MGIQSYLSVTQIEDICGFETGSVNALIWVVMQEEAAGARRKDVAEGLGVAEEDISRLIEDLVEGDQAKWDAAITALRASHQMNQQVMETGWDAIEAMAVEKLSQQLASMGGLGDPDQILRIASAANKAQRPSRNQNGAVQRAGSPQGAGGGAGNLSVELQSGNLGKIHLNISQAVRKQLSDDERVIDGEPRETRNMPHLKMLRLEETRELADSALDKRKDAGKFDFSHLGDESEDEGSN